MPKPTRFLLGLLVTSLLAGTAAAQGAPPLAPPSGPVVAPGPDRGPGGIRHGDRGDRGDRVQRRHRLPPRLRAALVARFDHDGDGRLTGAERQRAKRFLKRLRRQHDDHRGAMGGRGGMGGRGAVGGGGLGR